MDERTDGARALDEFLSTRNIKLTVAGDALGVSASTVYDLRNGRKRPKAPLAARIERWSDGRIPVTSWLTPEEASEIAETQPFAPDDSTDVPAVSADVAHPRSA